MLPLVRSDLSILNFVAMSFRIVLVSLAFFFIARGFVRAVAEGLIPGKTAHANPDRLCLRFDFERSSVRFHNSAHDAKVTRAFRAWQALTLGHGRVIARQFNDCLLLR